MTDRLLAVRELVEDPALGVRLIVAAGDRGLDRTIRSSRIQKSGLALAGHFHGIESDRIQIIGVTEMTYLNRLAPRVCHEAVRHFFERDLCCVVVTETKCGAGEAGEEADEDVCGPTHASDALAELANEMDTPLLFSAERSSRTITALHALLDERLAPRERIHGVLVDVFEVGLLLLGSSGVGKSEVALELIMRGHRLVADDVVECSYRPPGMVFGAPADLLRHHLEVRGLGILNIKDLFGVTAFRDRKRIDVVVCLEDSPVEAELDRLGLEERYHRILDVDVPEPLIPVRPGRDTASILEIAARSELLKLAGHHPAREFFGRFGAAHEVTGVDEPPPSTRLAERAEPPPRRSPFLRGAETPPESSVGIPPFAANKLVLPNK